MPDTPPPPIGFHPDLLQSQAHQHASMPYFPPGYELSYPMTTPMQRAVQFEPLPDDLNENVDVVKNASTMSDSGCTWQYCNINGPFPTNLVRAGIDSDGTIIYAGRAFHEGDMIPAKVLPDKNAAYVCYGGEEVLKEDFEILRSGDFVWEFSTNGMVPAEAVQIGKTTDGEPLFMGRALHQGTQTPGKIQQSHGCLYIPFGGEEVPIHEYEVLCLK